MFLSTIDEVYVATGEVQISGTGRNQKSTRIVSLERNYSSIPISAELTSASGNAMKLSQEATSYLSDYWSHFGAVSSYKVTLPGKVGRPSILTKNGERAVGSLIKSKATNGSLLLLPDIDFEADEFFTNHAQPKSTQKGIEFSARFIEAVVALDRNLKSQSEVTPEPTWATNSIFATRIETHLQEELLQVEGTIERAASEKLEIQGKLADAGVLRGLLYETGKRLESSILEALRILGFRAASYQDSQSEFDAVFESAEGRLLGEVEGKDVKAINIEKLRQLSLNIHEDLRRDTVTSPAKGILFGNGFRLSPPDQRGCQFTEKCISSSTSIGIGLVATSDLFECARYVLESSHTNGPFN